ncbi:MAG: hypothetical protein Q7T53_06925 [Deltaproteobacteria bacterium]|nr:hypothetical protein [Deltaproteobacteria bacterium]
MTEPDLRTAIVSKVCNVEETEQPFGKRWNQEVIELNPDHLAALKAGQLLALDVQGEYVVFLRVKKDIKLEEHPGKELGGVGV